MGRREFRTRLHHSACTYLACFQGVFFCQIPRCRFTSYMYILKWFSGDYLEKEIKVPLSCNKPNRVQVTNKLRKARETPVTGRGCKIGRENRIFKFYTIPVGVSFWAVLYGSQKWNYDCFCKSQENLFLTYDTLQYQVVDIFPHHTKNRLKTSTIVNFFVNREKG